MLSRIFRQRFYYIYPVLYSWCKFFAKTQPIQCVYTLHDKFRLFGIMFCFFTTRLDVFAVIQSNSQKTVCVFVYVFNLCIYLFIYFIQIMMNTKGLDFTHFSLTSLGQRSQTWCNVTSRFEGFLLSLMC